MADSMDREIDPRERRQRLAARLVAATAAVAAVAAGLIYLPSALRPGLDRRSARIARVDRGPVEEAMEASGTAVPAREVVLSSPVEARVERILKRAGETVRSGEEILALDTSESRQQIQGLLDRLEQKRNEMRQERLALDDTLGEIEGRIRAQELDLESARYRLGQQRSLRAAGLASEEALRDAEVVQRKAEIALARLRESQASARTTTDARLEGLALDIRILEGEIAEARRRLELATTAAPGEGVVTWTVPQEGATVRRGDVLARVADLSAFRIEASLSDVHAARLALGGRAHVVLGGEEIPGTIASIFPAIENGAVKFTVDLDAASDPRLRPNLRVGVRVVTGERETALRLARGPSVRGTEEADLYVVRGSVARRTRVRLGLIGPDAVEVLGGLDEGDEVIISDLRDYEHMEEIPIR